MPKVHRRVEFLRWASPSISPSATRVIGFHRFVIFYSCWNFHAFSQPEELLNSLEKLLKRTIDPACFVKNNIQRVYSTCLQARLFNFRRVLQLFRRFRCFYFVVSKSAIAFTMAVNETKRSASSGKRDQKLWKCIAIRRVNEKKRTVRKEIRVVQARWRNCSKSILPDALFQPCFPYS